MIPGLGRSAGEGLGSLSSIPELPWGLSWQRICLQLGRPGFDPWAGKIPLEKGIDTHYQCSGLENSTDSAVHAAAELDTTE